MKIGIYHRCKKIGKPYLELIEEYKKRLSKDAKVELVPMERIKEKDPKAYRIAIRRGAPLLSSEELAAELQSLALQSKSRLGFYIEPVEGSAEREEADFAFALLTNRASEEMIISVLIEQIYRAFSIQKGRSYHK